MGGHHLGDAPDEPTAVRMVQEACDGGITSSTIAGNTIAASPKYGWGEA